MKIGLPGFAGGGRKPGTIKPPSRSGTTMGMRGASKSYFAWPADAPK
jgi:hypothetical protein